MEDLKKADLEFIDKRYDLTEEQIMKYNKKLCERYPFLAYDQEYLGTWLDDIPDGWRKAIGIELCEELRKDLIKCNYLNEYRIVQAKEKYAELRLYSGGYPEGSKSEEIIDKYTEISRKICNVCGKPATCYSLGWILPYCDECIGDLPHKNYDWFVMGPEEKEA